MTSGQYYRNLASISLSASSDTKFDGLKALNINLEKDHKYEFEITREQSFFIKYPTVTTNIVTTNPIIPLKTIMQNAGSVYPIGKWTVDIN